MANALCFATAAHEWHSNGGVVLDVGHARNGDLV